MIMFHFSSHARLAAGAAVLSALLCSCGAARQTKIETAAAAPPSLPAPAPYQGRKVVVDIGPPERACGLVQVHFFYDATIARPQAEPELRGLAHCLNDGTRRRDRVELTGHTDSRGSRKYNQKLGLERALWVKSSLIRYGVAPSRIEVASRGEQDAKGDRPLYSRGYDRRVDAVEAHVFEPR